MWTYAMSKLGDLRIVYCSKKCEGDAKEGDRYVDGKRFGR